MVSLDGGRLRASITPDLAALGMDDRAQSNWNRTPSTIYLWSDAGYQCSSRTGWPELRLRRPGHVQPIM
ncbi:peptidase inhibitor family I36 protein [Streptomyces sp. NRRL F-2799]|uniref:peptidase inhibitor family I36 protein n=1 Tax=Streptomyces sp. NRRL F-2799 TaxID=1463844 RepID=UPI003B63F129